MGRNDPGLLEVTSVFNDVVQHSDDGGDYVSLIPYLQGEGIESHIIPAYNPELKRKSKRMNRKLVKSARSMTHNSNISRSLWVEAFVFAAEVRN